MQIDLIGRLYTSSRLAPCWRAHDKLLLALSDLYIFHLLGLVCGVARLVFS